MKIHGGGLYVLRLSLPKFADSFTHGVDIVGGSHQLEAVEIGHGAFLRDDISGTPPAVAKVAIAGGNHSADQLAVMHVV